MPAAARPRVYTQRAAALARRIAALVVLSAVTLLPGVAGNPWSGTATLRAAGDVLTVLQWNTYHGGYGTDGVFNPDRQVSWMVSRNADVISLNEVTATNAASFQAKVEAATGVTWYSHHIAAQSDGTGNQILSRYPFLSTSIYRMRTNGTYARGVAQATIDVGGRAVDVFSTHLDNEDDAIRSAQVQELVTFMSGFAEPRIVAGDLNATPDAGSIQALGADYVDTWGEAVLSSAATAYPPDNPADAATRTQRARIDYVFYSEWSANVAASSAAMPDTRDLTNTNVTRLLGTPDDRGVRPSDHNPFWVTLQFRQSTDSTPPSVSIQEPEAGATVSGTVRVVAAASDDHRVNVVDLKVDGTVVATDSSAPFEFAWDSHAVADGPHTLVAVAVDPIGNVGESAAVSVNVQAASVSYGEVVLHTADAPALYGTWAKFADASAASGTRVGQPDAGAAKISTALASPVDYFDMAFEAEAGRAYRLWLRGKAENNNYNNDSVHVQFSDSIDANGVSAYRIGTTSSTPVVLEDCSGCGLSGWGWQDNGYGAGVLGPLVYFETTGTHTVRIQEREDGLSIDQIVLSPQRYLLSAPGSLKNDTTILARTSGATVSNTPPLVSLTSPADGAAAPVPATFTITASATDSDGTIRQVDFYAEGNHIGAAWFTPYTISWTTSTPGTYTLTAVATDDAGALTTSAGVTVVVSGSTLSLSATGTKVKGVQRVDLAWTGAASADVDVFRDGVRIAVTANDGAYTDNLNRRGAGTYDYMVCEAGTSACSPPKTVGF